MKCPNCHTEIDDDSIFCPHCGKVIEIPCPKCGKKNASNSKFCKFCGELLEKKEPENEKQEKAPVDKTKRKEKVSRILSIIAMSGMIFSMVLLFGLSFGPFMEDDFYSASMFTVIGYTINAVKPGIKEMVDARDILPLINSILMLAWLLLITIFSIIFIAKGVPKLVNAIKEKKYFDFSKNVVVLYVLFITLFVYFKGFAYSEDSFCEKCSGCAMFAVIFVFLLLAFNLFVKEFNEQRHDYGRIIFRASSRILAFIFILVILFSIGGTRYSLQIYYMPDNSNPLYPLNEQLLSSTNSGELGAITLLIKGSKYVYTTYSDQFVPLFIVVAIPLVLECVIFVFGNLSLKNLFAQDVNKPAKGIANVISCAVMFVLSIGNIIALVLSKEIINSFAPAKVYGLSTICDPKISLPITILVFSVLLLANSIVILVLENKNKEQNNEEAK